MWCVIWLTMWLLPFISRFKETEERQKLYCSRRMLSWQEAFPNTRSHPTSNMPMSWWCHSLGLANGAHVVINTLGNCTCTHESSMCQSLSLLPTISMRCPITHTVTLQHNGDRIVVNAVPIHAIPVLYDRITNETNACDRFAMKAMTAHMMPVLCNWIVNETICKPVSHPCAHFK